MLFAMKDGSIRNENGDLVALFERGALPDGRGWLHYAGEMLVCADDAEAFDLIAEIG